VQQDQIVAGRLYPEDVVRDDAGTPRSDHERSFGIMMGTVALTTQSA
jgi:hypothetical protein